MNASWIVYPFFALFIIAGASIMLHGMGDILKARAIETWPKVDAKLIHCELKTIGDESEDTQEVTVSYSYEVNGREFSNNKIHPCYGYSNLDGHTELYTRLKKASVVRARYNAVDPQESFIVVGHYGISVVPVYIGLLFLGGGICFLLLFHFGLTDSSDFVSGLEVVK